MKNEKEALMEELQKIQTNAKEIAEKLNIWPKISYYISDRNGNPFLFRMSIADLNGNYFPQTKFGFSSIDELKEIVKKEYREGKAGVSVRWLPMCMALGIEVPELEGRPIRRKSA